MELVDYLRVLRRRSVLIVLAALVCAAAAVAFSFTQAKQYDASARYSVSVPSADGQAESILAVTAAGTTAQFATTGPGISAAVQSAGYQGAADVTATNSDQTRFVTITVRDSSAQRAAAIANAYRTSLPAVVQKLTTGTLEQLNVLESATPPSKAAKPDTKRNGLVGLGLGLVVGVGAAFLREALDSSFASPDRLEDSSGVSVLGVVPQELSGVPLPAVSHTSSARAEAYRTVRTNIQFAGPEHTLKTLVVTSATPGEGKTTVSTNLAVAFARTGQTVVLVDADLRRPRAAKAFSLDGAVGLTEVLSLQKPVEEALQLVEENLWVLPSGAIPDNPSELLGSTRMVSLLADLASRFEVVLLDTPPILPVTDPLVLAVQATGVVLVVKLGETSRDRLKRALGALGKLDVPLLGIVANGAIASTDPAYSYGYKYGYGSADRT